MQEPTIRQKEAVGALLGKTGRKARSVAEAMRRAGYSKGMVKNPHKLTRSDGFRILTAPIVTRLEIERDRAIRAMAGKIGKAKYRDLAEAVDKLQKNIQLLSGGATETQLTITLSPEIAQKNRIEVEAREPGGDVTPALLPAVPDAGASPAFNASMEGISDSAEQEEGQ